MSKTKKINIILPLALSLVTISIGVFAILQYSKYNKSGGDILNEEQIHEKESRNIIIS